MENVTSNKNLFNKFAPVSIRQWEEKIVKDLKGKPYSRLIRKTAEGFEIKPFYREEDLKNSSFTKILPAQFPYLRGKHTHENSWLVRQDIVVNEFTQANKKALDVSARGIDSLGFIFPENTNPGEEELKKLLENIRADSIELNFSGGNANEILMALDRLAKKHHYNLDKIKGSLNVDPLGEFSMRGRFARGEKIEFDTLVKLFKTGEYLPAFQLITVNAHLFHNAGGGIISELACALAMGAEYLTFLTDQGFSIDEVAPKIRFHFAVGSEYFMEIAKFRALKLLWAKMVDAYGLEKVENSIAHIHASSSWWNKTIYDPYVNMLRTTTETMSALIGGIDSMTVLPFDSVFSEGNDFSNRIARNQQLVLKEESYFNKVVDPAAGSYYIENLTGELIQHAWNLFLEIEEQGGYNNAFRKGMIQSRIQNEAAEKDRNLAFRKQSMLGINQFPNSMEQLDKLSNEGVLFVEDVDESKVDAKPLKRYRGASAYEQLRYRTDRFADNNPRPKVWMLTYGNLSMRRVRSQFAENFFGVAGFEIIDNQGFETVEQGVKAAKKSNPDIVVLCASDEDYKTMDREAITALKSEFIVVLAGYPTELVEHLKAAGMENFIHVKSNVLEELKRYQQMLGI
ncbi:MAG: methylmalonyl-CoA mutase small subunit [Bacteroidetes bacterium]|nr:MAG: methylmalonyl-CoA mutase small subunit [Bacteroidota bacterium]